MTEYRVSERWFDEVGLRPFDQEKIDVAVEKLAGQLSTTPTALLDRCRTDPKARRLLIGACTVGESHFFRHREQLDFAADYLEKRTRRGLPSSVWSGGCARGEEVYTLAMILHERLGRTARKSVSLSGTDLSAASIQTARQGVFNEWSLRGVDEQQRRCFRKVGDSFHVAPEISGWPEFHQGAIVEHLDTLPTSCLDLVLFRNVALYLTQSALDQIHTAIARVLAPGGLLVQAVTDVRPNPGILRPHPGGITGTYWPTTKVLPSWLPPPAENAGSKSTVGVPRSVAMLRASEKTLRGRAKAPTLESLSRATSSSSSLTSAKSARPAFGQRTITPSNTPGETHVTPKRSSRTLESARSLMDRELPCLAADALRGVLFADPDDFEARYWYVLSLRACGQVEQATRQLQDLRRKLEKHAPARVGAFETRELLASLSELEGAVS